MTCLLMIVRSETEHLLLTVSALSLVYHARDSFLATCVSSRMSSSRAGKEQMFTVGDELTARHGQPYGQHCRTDPVATPKSTQLPFPACRPSVRRL